jgi:hypothetical protein
MRRNRQEASPSSTSAIALLRDGFIYLHPWLHCDDDDKGNGFIHLHP